MSIARTKYKVTKSLLLLGILCTGLLSAFIGLVAFFGQYMGTFVISLDEGTSSIGITLSEEVDFKTPSSRLLVNPVNSAKPVTFFDIDFHDIVSTDGNFDITKTNNYIGYTFYIRNEGNTSVDIQLSMKTIEATLNVDAATRIAILEDAYVNDEDDLVIRNGNLYMKDEVNQDERIYSLMDDYYKNLYDSLNKVVFTDDEVLDNYAIDDFKPGEVRKFSLMIWLEGWDYDCNDNIKLGKLKMKLTFTIRNINEDEE